MMPENETQPGPENDVEQREKKEASEKQGGEKTAEQLRKEVASERARNEKLDKLNQEQGGAEGNDKQKGPDRLQQLIRRELEATCQRQLGMNENTDFSRMDTNDLRQKYSLIQQSRAFVSSHTAESAAPGLRGELKRAFDAYKAENPDDAGEGGMKGADSQQAAEILKTAALKSLEIMEKKIVDELQKRGINPEQEREQRETNGDQVKVVRAAPSDKAFSGRSRNAMREFRNLIWEKGETPDKISYRQLIFSQPKNEQERGAAKKFNAVVDKCNDALGHCEQNNANSDEKNVRAALVKEYGEQLVGRPIDATDSLPNFRDWLAQHPDKVKQAQEQNRKTAD